MVRACLWVYPISTHQVPAGLGSYDLESRHKYTLICQRKYYGNGITQMNQILFTYNIAHNNYKHSWWTSNSNKQVFTGKHSTSPRHTPDTSVAQVYHPLYHRVQQHRTRCYYSPVQNQPRRYAPHQHVILKTELHFPQNLSGRYWCQCHDHHIGYYWTQPLRTHSISRWNVYC